jgi:hypothetical protein
LLRGSATSLRTIRVFLHCGEKSHSRSLSHGSITSLAVGNGYPAEASRKQHKGIVVAQPLA